MGIPVWASLTWAELVHFKHSVPSTIAIILLKAVEGAHCNGIKNGHCPEIVGGTYKFPDRPIHVTRQ